MLADIVRVVLPFSARKTSTKAHMAQLLRIKLFPGLMAVLAGCVTTSSVTPREAWQAVREEDAHFAQVTFDGGQGGGGAAPGAEAIMARQHELKQWVYPLVTSYLPPGIPLPMQIHLTADEENPFEPYADGIDVAIGSGNTDQAWTHLVRRLYVAGLTNLAAGKLTVLPLPLVRVPTEPVRSNADLNRNLLSSLWVEGLSTFVAAHGERLSEHRTGVLSWQQRSLITPSYMDVRDILALEEDARERWTRLLRLESSEALFSRIGANMAGRIEQELGVEGLVLALGRGPEGFYAVFMGLSPGALVSFELAPEAQQAPNLAEPLPPQRVTH